MKKVVLVTVAVVVVVACGETVGGMMQDAGAMLADAGDAIRDAGDMMQPDAGAQDVSASCSKSATIGGGSTTVYWAEFPISDPGKTQITICYDADSSLAGPSARVTCYRYGAGWYEGTSTGFLDCGTDQNRFRSITVHN